MKDPAVLEKYYQRVEQVSSSKEYDAIKKAIDYCNCRIASAYCKQYSDMTPESKESKSYSNIKYIFKCSISESLSYDSINNILQENDFPNFMTEPSTISTGEFDVNLSPSTYVPFEEPLSTI